MTNRVDLTNIIDRGSHIKVWFESVSWRPSKWRGFSRGLHCWPGWVCFQWLLNFPDIPFEFQLQFFHSRDGSQWLLDFRCNERWETTVFRTSGNWNSNRESGPWQITVFWTSCHRNSFGRIEPRHVRKRRSVCAAFNCYCWSSARVKWCELSKKLSITKS